MQRIFTNKYYKRYYTIRRVNGENLAEINVIRVNTRMEGILYGKPKKVIELSDGSILVEVSNEEQSHQIQNLHKVDNVEVTTLITK